MYENESSHNEGNPEIEALEQKTFGKNYEQVEKVHYYAENNSWIHPLVGIILFLVIVAIIIILRRKKNIVV